jgi:hypothetical protein
MVTLIKNTKHVSFMPYVFNQNKHHFGQCEHFNHIEPFENS